MGDDLNIGYYGYEILDLLKPFIDNEKYPFDNCTGYLDDFWSIVEDYHKEYIRQFISDRDYYKYVYKYNFDDLVEKYEHSKYFDKSDKIEYQYNISDEDLPF